MKKILASALLMLSAAAAMGQANTGGNVPYYNTGGAGVSAAGIQSVLLTQSGCSTAGYVYSPQSGTCVAPGGSAVTFPTGILYGSGSTAAPTQATNTQLSGAVTTAYGYTPLAPNGSGASLTGISSSQVSGLGTAATQNTGTSGANVPLLNGANTHSGASTFSAAGTASTPGLSVTGAPYTGGTASTNYPQQYDNCTGSTQPTNFNTSGTMLGINGCSGFGGDLFAGWNNGGTKLWSFSTSGSATFNNSLGFGGTLFATSTTAPTMAAGAAAGTSPTCTSVTGNNNTMVLSCTTGTSTTASGTLATITFNAALSPVPKGCSLTPRNAISAIAPNDVYTTAPSSTTFTIAVGTTALSASTAYSWSVICL